MALNGYSFIPNSGDNLPKPAIYVITEQLSAANGTKIIVKEDVFLHKSHLRKFSAPSGYTCNKPYTHGWFYTSENGWLWMTDETYPYFYKESDGGWLYFFKTGSNSFFIDYTNGGMKKI